MTVLAAEAASIDIHPALAGVMVWLLLAAVSKAIGMRVQPGRISETIWDIVLDVITLMMIWQAALSLTDAPLFTSIVNKVKGTSENMAGASGWTFVTTLVLGLVFLALTAWAGIKFSKNDDDLKLAWKYLAFFSVFAMVTSRYLPWFEEFADAVSDNVATPIGKMVAVGLTDILNIQFV